MCPHPMAPCRRPAAARLLVATALLAAPAAAHDFWIEPSSFSPPPGAPVALHLRVGQHFLGDPVPRRDDLVARFVALAPGGVGHPVRGVDGVDPAGFVRAPAPGAGTLVVAYESRPTSVDLTPEKLDRYLTEEGLEAVAESRRQRGETRGARDAFSRHAKVLLRPPGAATGGYDRVVGLELELVPETDPGRLAGDGGALTVRLLFEGAPLAGALVKAIPRRRPRDVLATRTDADGRVTLRLTPDRWLVEAVHARREGSGGDLRSYWTSLTFAIDGPGTHHPDSSDRSTTP